MFQMGQAYAWLQALACRLSEALVLLRVLPKFVQSDIPVCFVSFHTSLGRHGAPILLKYIKYSCE